MSGRSRRVAADQGWSLRGVPLYWLVQYDWQCTPCNVEYFHHEASNTLCSLQPAEHNSYGGVGSRLRMVFDHTHNKQLPIHNDRVSYPSAQFEDDMEFDTAVMQVLCINTGSNLDEYHNNYLFSTTTTPPPPPPPPMLLYYSSLKTDIN